MTTRKRKSTRRRPATTTANPGASPGTVAVRAYLSPTLVLLAFDWAAGAKYSDFLGFAILRSPGFVPGERDGYLLNKVGFTPPQPGSQSLPSNLAPFQKFMWWDSGINTVDRGKKFTYTVAPVRGTGATDLHLQHDAETAITVVIPTLVDANRIGTYFNRAVVSSQSFTRKFADWSTKPATLDAAMDWLANGMQAAVPSFLQGARGVSGAIYHLTDNRWILPALRKLRDGTTLVYDWKPGKSAADGETKSKGKTKGSAKGKGGSKGRDTVNAAAVESLKHAGGFTLDPRTRGSIMHDKLLVRRTGGAPTNVLAGSANFTPEGITEQANVLHTFDSPGLAKLYAARAQTLTTDPPMKAIAQKAWSAPVSIGSAKARVFFSPEPRPSRVSLDTVVAAVKAAKRSVVFCMFSPTDPPLLTALLNAGDTKLMYGLLNAITDPTKRNRKAIAAGKAPPAPTAATKIQVTLYNRSRADKKVLAYSYFAPGKAPAGFLPEFNTIDTGRWNIGGPPPPPRDTGGKKSGKKKRGGPPAVHIHHKFIVIDAETKTPTIYTGSANFSANSTYNNDENLLEITGSPELARTYLAEFLRLYEHFRARAIWNEIHGKGSKHPKHGAAPADAFVLRTTRDGWVRKAYVRGTPDYRARSDLSSPA